MAADKARQERLGVTVLSVGALFLAVTGWIDRPEPGEIAEQLPGWYMGFKAVLHGAIGLGVLKTGDTYAITCGEPMGHPGGTNMLKVCRVG